jgi:hypothetical protein
MSVDISRRGVAIVVAAAAAAVTLFVVFATAGGPPGTGEPPAGSGEAPAAGWRWESYDGVEVQVPDEWGHGTTNTPPCLDVPGGADQPKQPGYVGRPGIVATIGCSISVPPLDKRTPYLWFDSHADAGVREHDAGWVEETRVVGDLALTVFSDDATLRTRILDSARPAGTTGTGPGCAAEHAVTTGPDAHPDPGPGGLAAMGRVTSITLCRYALGEESKVLAGSQLTGEEAQAVVRAILAAPEGDGPNEPGNCAPEVAFGEEVLLLTARDSARGQEVFVRYSGCDGHGFDDGQTHRRLTSDALKPLLSGPHEPSSLSGAVGELLWR